MGYETIRRIDVYIGSILCAILTLARRVMDGGANRGNRQPPRRLLFLKLIEQGATVLACDAIRLATDRLGRENVYFCVFAENRPIVDILDLVPPQNVFSIRSDRLGLFLLDTIRALIQIRRARIDAVADMEFFSRASAIIAFLSGAHLRAGLHRFTAEAPYRGDLFTHRLQHNPYLHVSQGYRLLVEALWADPGDPPLVKTCPAAKPIATPSFVPSDEERARMRAAVGEAAGMTLRGPLVVLNANPGDRLPLRRWPQERFIELGRRLLDERLDLVLALTGTPSERGTVEAMCSQLGPRAVSVAGRTTLRELLALFTLADVLITTDSGPGHFAALTSIDSIVLFGPETPMTFGPLGPRSQSVTAGLACSPCLNAYNHRFSPCRYNACLHAISVDEVFSRVQAVLSTRVSFRAGERGAA